MLRFLPALCALLLSAAAADLPLTARMRLAGALVVAVMQCPAEQAVEVPAGAPGQSSRPQAPRQIGVAAAAYDQSLWQGAPPRAGPAA